MVRTFIGANRERATDVPSDFGGIARFSPPSASRLRETHKAWGFFLKPSASLGWPPGHLRKEALPACTLTSLIADGPIRQRVYRRLETSW